MAHVTATNVRLGNTLVRPGDAVRVLGVAGYDGRSGRFQGVHPSGRLAVKITLGSYKQTCLSLTRDQVRAGARPA
jgi:hypothetical protein